MATRWADIIKNGLAKEKINELKEKYPPPENCKTLGAPKLNLEAQAAIVEVAVKRDKAIAAKQDQVGRALTALATVFGKLCKNKENAPIINVVVDAARLLCDHQHQETTTRKNFILQGLEQTTREAIKDTETDTWLFGEGFSEKLKASKAIKKSAQEISMNKPKKPTNQQQQKHLNFKGPATHQPRGRVYQPGPQRFYQSYKKPMPAAQSAFQKAYPKKTPMRINNHN